MMSRQFQIDGIKIGGNEKCYVIAEMSANHGGNLDEALKIIRSAKEAGANAVKLQTYRADTITLNSSKEDFQLPSKNPWEKYHSLYSLYEKAFTPWDWHEELFAEARRVGISIFSSPFDISAVDFLEDLGCPAYKIASPEITDIPLIERVAKTGKPIIISTGLSDLDDISLAVETVEAHSNSGFAILRCTTAYPAPVSDTNLQLLPDIAKRFNCVVGLSDHSLGATVPLAAIHYGSKILEKHFMLDCTDSVDGFFSLDAHGFKEMIENMRINEEAIGTVNYDIPQSAKANLFARRSLYISADVSAGEIISEQNIKSVRPGYGLHPKYWHEVLGKAFTRNCEAGDRLTPEDIDGFIPLEKRKA